MSTKKRICFSIGCVDDYGGTERVTCNLASELAKKYDVYMLSLKKELGKPAFELKNNVKLFYLFDKKCDYRRDFFKIRFRMKKFLEQEKIDVVILVDATQAIFVEGLLKKRKYATIAWEHFNSSIYKKTIIEFLPRVIASKKSDCIVTLTKNDLEFYINNFKPKARITSIYNINTLKPNKMLEKKNIILSVGRCVYVKGFDMLLEAAALVIKDKVSDDWEWNIVGDGQLRGELEEKATKLKIDKFVKFRGTQDDMRSFYEESKFLVMTSRNEGLPLAVIEAQAFSNPVISFDCGAGSNELIRNNENGFIISNYDISDMAQKIIALMKDEKLIEKMSKEAIIDAKKFDCEAITNQWIKLIEDIEN